MPPKQQHCRACHHRANTASAWPFDQYKPSTTAGKKHAAYKLPEKMVICRISPGGSNATTAANSAKNDNQQACPQQRSGGLRKGSKQVFVACGRSNQQHTVNGRHGRCNNRHRQKSAAHNGNMAALLIKVGTIKSVSLTLSNNKWAYMPMG